MLQGLMRAQGADLTRQVCILSTAVNDFVRTVTGEHADSRPPSVDCVDGHSGLCAPADSSCENSAPARDDETGLSVNATAERADLDSRVERSVEDAAELDKCRSACPTHTGPATETADKQIANTAVSHKTVHQPTGHSLVTKTKRCHGDRNRRSREPSRDVDIRQHHDSYADRLICKVARMTRVDVADLGPPRTHDGASDHHRRRHGDEQFRYRPRRHCDSCSGDAENSVNNSSPVTISSGYESDVDCIREEEIDTLLHGDCSTAGCRERLADQSTANCRETFVIRPDDKYDANYAMSALAPSASTGRRGVNSHRNVQHLTSPRVYHDHTRKLSRVARSMEQIIRDLQSPRRLTKRSAKPEPRAHVMQLPVDGGTCGVSEEKPSNMPQIGKVMMISTDGGSDTEDLTRSSGDKLGCDESEMLSKAALRLQVVHHSEGRSAFRPYKSCTSDGTRSNEEGEKLYPRGSPNDAGQPGNMNTTDHLQSQRSEAPHTPRGQSVSVRIACSPPILPTHRSASPDSGRGSWSNYGTSPDSADRKRQPAGTSWRDLHGLSQADAFVESEPIYETIDDGAMLSRVPMSEHALPPPLPQRPVRGMRHLSARDSKYSSVGERALSGWGNTPPRLPPREHQKTHRRRHCSTDTDTCDVPVTDNADNNTHDDCPTFRKTTSAPSSGCDVVTMRCQQPEVRHLEDIVKSSDIVDLSGAHVYTVADVLESIHGYVGHLTSGHLTSGVSQPDKPTVECAITRSFPKPYNDSIGPDTDYHLLTKATQSATSSDTRCSSKTARDVQYLFDARSSYDSRVSLERRSLQDDSADWRRPQGCESRDLEMRTICADVRRCSSDLVWSGNRPLQGTFC